MRQVMDLAGRQIARITLVCTALIFFGAATTNSAGGRPGALPKLKPETETAFEHYVRLTDERNTAELKQGSPFLQIDALPEQERRTAYESLRAGRVWIEKRQTKDGGKEIRCPSGLIHHWEAISFIPGATVDDVLRVLEDYDHHSQFYKPDVERSKTLAHDGDHYQAFLRFRRHKIITVVLNTTHDVNYFRDSNVRAHSRSSAIKIAEVEDAGKNDEREKPAGDDGGFLWRMETWWRVGEKDGGVYIQSEVASLTRDIPTGLGWMIGPFVNGIPKETLAFTMDATRKAVLGKKSSEASMR